MKRGGSMSVIVIFTLFFLAVTTAYFTASVQKQKQTSLERLEYAKYYNECAIAKIAMEYHIGQMCGSVVTLPLTPLNSTVYAYEEALSYVAAGGQPEVRVETLLEVCGNSLVTDKTTRYFKNTNISVAGSALAPDWGNTENILRFRSGDILYLEPIEIRVKVAARRHTKSYTFVVRNMYCEVTHKNGSLTLSVSDSEMMIGAD